MGFTESRGERGCCCGPQNISGPSFRGIGIQELQENGRNTGGGEWPAINRKKPDRTSRRFIIGSRENDVG
ncbi:MAG TPA: hypothetical protein VLX29_02035 [Nitrospirota bacterium]|nr:hypothetical protein [Nitrospirota bacterium]